MNNTLELYDTDEPPQMYLSMFSDMEGVNVDIVRPLEQKAIEENIHPWIIMNVVIFCVRLRTFCTPVTAI